MSMAGRRAFHAHTRRPKDLYYKRINQNGIDDMNQNVNQTKIKRDKPADGVVDGKTQEGDVSVKRRKKEFIQPVYKRVP
jgi:hypothetical protein